MLDAKQSADSPRDRFSTKEPDTTFQRILQLTEQVCRRFETKWPLPTQNELSANRSPSKWPIPLRRR
jgi:hypothetical protein